MRKPSFSAAWAASLKIYDPQNPTAKVAENTCAVRMSYILNQSGFIIPAVVGQTVSGKDKLARLLLPLLLLASTGYAQQINSPQAGTRTYGQNYKDMVLAECIATAWKDEKSVVLDAGSSASALQDWSNYDWEKTPYSRIKPLIEKYLKRNYHNPLVESEIKGVRFDLLKCFDLYHSKELEALTREAVINPERSYRQDNP